MRATTFSRLAQVVGAVLAGLCMAGPARADHVTTVDGQSLEGLIREENRYFISLDVRGVIIPIPRNRIKELTHASLDDNVRALLDRAQEARSRDDLSTARTLIEQARAQNSHNPALIESLRQQDKDLTDLEKRGGTPEERRAKAEVLLERSNDAFDKIRIQEGNNLLLQALKTDPSYEEAQRKMAELLQPRKATGPVEGSMGNNATPGMPGGLTPGNEVKKGGGLSTRNVDAEMAAEYFATAVWPDHLTPDNPVLPLLPGIYHELSLRFDTGTDIPRAQHVAELMQAIHEAWEKHPEWKKISEGDEAGEAMLQQPVQQLLANLVENNLKRGNAEFALQKLVGWSDPNVSPEMALMVTRANVGAGNYSAALAVLEKANETFPNDIKLVPHMNALKLMVDADTSVKMNRTDVALANYQKVFGQRESLVPEVGQRAGQELASIRFHELEAIQPGVAPTGYQTADVAAQVITFSTEVNRQRRAAQVLAAAIPRVSWNLELGVGVNGSMVAVDPALREQAKAVLSKPFQVDFDDHSPFLLRLNVNFNVAITSASQVSQAISAGSTGLSGNGAAVTGLGFGLVATHPSLGQLLRLQWNEPSVPAALIERHEKLGITANAAGAPQFWVLQKSSSVGSFIATDLPDYMLGRVGLLNNRVQVPKLQELLGAQGIAEAAQR